MKQIALLLIFGICLLDASQADLSLNRHQFAIGPKYEHVRRSKKGGTKQSGELFGGEFNYDRLKRYGWYWGMEASWTKGSISGHTLDGEMKLKSYLTNQYLEGRVGYTFQQKDGSKASFTPFVGGGYLEEKNNFSSKYTLPLHVKTSFGYVSAGFLFWLNLSEAWDIGINLKLKLPYEPKCRITNDPFSESVRQTIGDRVQYRGELPITWTPFCNPAYTFLFKPFYEIRNYPSHPNFPFDYYKNSLKFMGFVAEFQYRL